MFARRFDPRELADRGTDRATLEPQSEGDEAIFAYGLQRFLLPRLASPERMTRHLVHRMAEVQG